MLDLTVQDRIHAILWDRRIVPIPPEIPSPTETVYILLPTVADRNIALYQRDKAYRDAIRQGVKTSKELLETAIENGHWDESYEKFDERCDKEIEDLELRLKDRKLLSQKKRLQNRIAEINKSRQSVAIQRRQICYYSADYLADESYVLYLVQQLCRTLDGQPLCINQRDYLELLIFLCNEVLSEGVWEIATIREIARSPEWRVTWTLNRENLTYIFNRPISDLGYNQKLLIYWSRVYDSVFEDTERPSSEIIDDNDKLDQWLQDRESKRDEKKDKKSSKITDHHEQIVFLDGYYVEECTCGAIDVEARGLGERPRHANNCMYGVHVKYTPEEKEEIINRTYNRNTDSVRQILSKEQDKVESAGIIKEQDLRNRKVRKLLGAPSK